MSITLRLPAEMHEELHRIAERDDRSLTAQITRFLRESIERDREQHGESDAPAEKPARRRR